MISIPNKGDFVTSSNHGHTGLVIDVMIATAQDDDWFNQQKIQPTPSQKAGVWITILIHGGGSANVPLDTISFIKPIEDFAHSGGAGLKIF